jgi:hypothetical protein
LNLQAAFEAADSLDMAGGPLAYAAHLSLAPLAGVPRKNALFQSDLGTLWISLADLQQIAQFFEGAANLKPDQYLAPPFAPSGIFQVSPVLPEQPGFLQIPR